MELPFQKDAETPTLHALALDFSARGNHIKALEILDDMLLVNKEDMNLSSLLLFEQGQIFSELAKSAKNRDVEFAYLLGSVGCFSEDNRLAGSCAEALHKLGFHLCSRLYYKKTLDKAKQGLYFSHLKDSGSLLHRLIYVKREELESLIKDAEFLIGDSETGGFGLMVNFLRDQEPKVLESKKSPDQPETDEIKGLRSYWLGLDVKIKRDFMKVSIAKLLSFVEGVHNKEGRYALQQVLTSAKEDKKWKFWACRTMCLKKFSSAEDYRNHLEQEHAADFKPSLEEDTVHRIRKDWTRKISVGGWEPVNAEAAVEMIKTRFTEVKKFKYKNGWSTEWPVVVDEERSKLLKEIKSLLVSFCDRKILSSSIRDWVRDFPVRYLGKFEVSKHSLTECHLVETPQSICFLEVHELNQILEFLRNIKCKRNDGTEVVGRAVDTFLGSTQIREKIDFDPEFSFLLLDKRLLKCSIPPLDDEGTINVFDPDEHYAKAHAQGDDIVSWIVDYASVDKGFPSPFREHNLDIWVAVLRAIHFTCKTLRTKYAKKRQLIRYGAALSDIEILCKREDDRRINLQGDQWNRYAYLLCDRCEERVTGISTTKFLLCAVRDVLDGASHPTFNFPNLEGCLNHIRARKSLSDDIVLNSKELLKSVVTRKVLLIDSKILLIDNSRISLLNNLTKLSLYDNRSYILQLLKPFLLFELCNMESKAKSDAVEAAANLLLEAEKKESQSKKKKNKSKKKTSTNMPSPLDNTVEQPIEPSANLGPEGTPPSLKVEEDSLEPKASLASEMGRLVIPSNTDNNQEEATKVDPGDMQNIPGEDSGRYNSALDMILKALLNTKILRKDLVLNGQPFHGNHPGALQNFFSRFLSEVINGDGDGNVVYSCLLRDLLASLDVIHSLSSNAAEVLVAILEYWHCWKKPERESLVTRLFTLEEYERVSCRKCRRKLNYPEQSSYGIVMAAGSIRQLKSIFGDIKFVDILKVIRTDYKKLCDTKTGGCGKTNFVHRIIRRCPPIFIIVLEWEKSVTKKQISETTKALECEIDISRLYGGLEPSTNYHLVSMVGCGEEEEHVCIAYAENQWVSLRPNTFAGEDVVGNWTSVVRFCEERKVRPEILCYEDACSMA